MRTVCYVRMHGGMHRVAESTKSVTDGRIQPKGGCLDKCKEKVHVRHKMSKWNL